MNQPKYSIIVPVYNRPQEVDELLASLTHQTYRKFEVIIVEDGSTITSEKVCERYQSTLSIRYFFKPNSGPGPSRNVGYQQARGDYFVIFDSDCILPKFYFEKIENFLRANPIDAWGGPDRASSTFTPLQQAMGYTMSSFFTTGGIRGGKEIAGKFQLRSFNMGISKHVFEKTGGFTFNRYAEDIEFSIRMRKMGFATALIPDAFVYHKRRSTLKQFFWQVFNFGRGRVQVGRVHAGEIKITHWFPSVFLLGIFAIPIAGIINPVWGLFFAWLYFVYFLIIAMDALIKSRSLLISILSIPSALVQLTGYGSGFLKEKFFSSGLK
jgi:glycosyltransferase involved in cell wall biosynthesis